LRGNKGNRTESALTYPESNRRITEEEYEEIVDYAIELGIENGFVQEGETAEESFIPSFDGEGV
jgi:putative pyruvate formate lyase activating enzyme